MAALMYNGVNSTIDALRGKHDFIGSIAAGALTGAVFKSTGGVPVSPSKSCCSILICKFWQPGSNPWPLLQFWDQAWPESGVM